MTKYNPLLSPLDYASKLAERYKRQDAQLERYHQQLRERDQQEYNAKTAVTPVKVLSQLADTINKVGSAAETIDELTAKKVKQKLDTYGATTEDFLRYRSGEQELDNDFTDLQGNLGPLQKRNAKAADYIKSLHGRSLFHAKKYYAAKRSVELPSMWSHQVSNDKVLQKEFLAIGKEDIESQKAFMRDWASQQFGDELLDGTLLFQTAGDNLNKWLDSKELLTREAIKKISTAQNETDWENLSNVFANNGDVYGYQQFLFSSFKGFKKEVVAAGSVEGGIKKAGNGVEVNGILVEGIDYQTEFKNDQEKQTYYNSIAKELFAQKLIRKGQVGYFSITERNLVNQASEVFKEYGGGDKLQNIFTKDQWDRIVTASNQGTALAARIATEQNAIQSQAIYTAAEAKYTNPENRGGTNEKNLQHNIDYLYSKGQDDLAKKLEVIQKSDQSPLSYHTQRIEWEPEIEKGLMNTKMADIEKITSVQLRNELTKLKEGIDKAILSFGGKEKFESIMKNDIQGLIQGDGKSLLNKMTGKLNGSAQYIYDDFDNLSKEALALGVQQGLTGDGLKSFIMERLRTEWDAGGGNLPAKNKNKGRYARTNKPDPFGNYTAWSDQRGKDARLAQRSLNTTTKKEFDDELTRSYSLVEDWTDNKFVENLISQSESVISKEDIRGIIENGFYSAELKYKARKLGIPYGTLFEAQVKAIQNDPELAEDVANFNIDDIQFLDQEAQIYEAITDKDALAMLKRQGIENLSLPQLQRLSFAFEGPKRAVDELNDTIEAGKIDPNIIATESDAKTIQKEKLAEIEKGNEDMATKLRSMTHPDGTQLYEEEAIQDLLDSGLALDELKKFYYNK